MDYEKLVYNSIPVFMVAGAVAVAGYVGYEALQPSHRQVQPDKILAFQPQSFNNDEIITAQFRILQTYRHFDPARFDAAGKNTDRFLGRFARVVHRNEETPTLKLANNMKKLCYFIREDLGQFHLKVMQTLGPNSGNAQMVDQDIEQSIKIINQQFTDYCRYLDHYVLHLKSNNNHNSTNQSHLSVQQAVVQQNNHVQFAPPDL